MARKPNYRFDRLQKDRAKAAKKAERLEAKRSKSAKGDQPGEDATSDTDGTDVAAADEEVVSESSGD